MPFKTILFSLITKVPGATGAVLADWEGETVEHCSGGDDYEVKVVGAHLAIILNQLKDLQARLAGEVINDAVITTADQRLVVGTVGSDYCLVLTLSRQVVAGKARFHFDEAKALLAKEIYSYDR